MTHTDILDIDQASPPFDRIDNVRRLATTRSGRGPDDHARHGLYTGRDKETRALVLVKLTTKPGLVYEQNLANEIASLTTINRELPDSRYFPLVLQHGRLPDSRVYLTTSLFDEFPLATAIGDEPVSSKMVTYLRIAIEIARALEQLHRLEIFHVDLNPMNTLYRSDKGKPVVRIVDFESSYERARHAAGAFYNPPTTPRYSAPEVRHQAPDARADVYSLGAVLYTMLAGYQWTLGAEAGSSVEADGTLDRDLKAILLKAVAVDPDSRYPLVSEMDKALGRYLETIWPGRSW